ncbi:MAG TPA: UTP--glucose-1-phosphate uridylyltransferase GalU [Acholeplasma sp.]|jgi:UTP--glucose-1-phosphate uridylyltransferase|nr:UTP--glucose-1-phosphate uridylyltransferase GalU [Acholeplasma sp.]
MIKKAVIPAAGFGTRFLPATKTVPKELFPIIDTPTLQLIVEEALSAGIEEILIITSASKNAIIDHFDRNADLERFLKEKNKPVELKIVEDVGNLADIHFIRQKEQKGLGHAILHAETFVGNEPFAVLLGDDLFKGAKPAIKELMEVYDKYGGSVVGTLEVSASETKKYGIVEPEKAMDANVFKLKGVVEKPDPSVAPSLSAISGRYILSPTIFSILRTQKPGVGGEIQLTDAILTLLKEEPVYSCDIIAKRYDIGSRVGYLEAIIDFGLDREDLKNQYKAVIIKKAEELLRK